MEDVYALGGFLRTWSVWMKVKCLGRAILEGVVLRLYGRRVRWRRFFENMERVDEGKGAREGVLEGVVL